MHLTGTNGVYDCESIVQHSLGIVAQVLLHHRPIVCPSHHSVVYPKPADNSISAKTGKTAMNSATSSCHMAQGN
jgi:hypothetical protein